MADETTVPAEPPAPGMVYVIDDDPQVRRMLQTVLSAASFPVTGYESAEQFLERFDPAVVSCIVLDLRLPGIGGVDLLRKLREAGNDIPIIVISGHASVAQAVQSIRLGAIDVLQKPFEPRVLVDLVKKGMEAARTLHQTRRERELIRQRFELLTPREMELLKLVVGGNSNKQIATRLGISIKTVANHRAHLMAKTGAVNAAELARFSIVADVAPTK